MLIEYILLMTNEKSNKETMAAKSTEMLTESSAQCYRDVGIK